MLAIYSSLLISALVAIYNKKSLSTLVASYSNRMKNCMSLHQEPADYAIIILGIIYY